MCLSLNKAVIAAARYSSSSCGAHARLIDAPRKHVGAVDSRFYYHLMTGSLLLLRVRG